ncbi:MAG TPA: hypothetical protein VLV78_01015 [Thermoanaerobaculia bacterium]|nr:hypothetical protein [Thermoanaerobaculia bacterium]
MARIACSSCHHEIDSAAKICPYCGSDPSTGQKVVDTNALMQEMFQPRQLSASETVLEYARHRQGIVIVISAIILFLVLAALHQFVTRRNEAIASTAPAVPLSEIADVSNLPDESKASPMPDLNFQYSGNPEAMRTFVVEQGAVAPPKEPPASAGTPPPKAGAPSGG